MQSSKQLAKKAIRKNADILALFALLAVFFVLFFALFEYFLREISANFLPNVNLNYVITIFIFFLHLLIFSPISFSLSALIFKSCADEKYAKAQNLFDAFSCKKLYFKVIFLNFSIFLRIFLRIFVAFLPYFLLTSLENPTVIAFLNLDNYSQIAEIAEIFKILVLILAFLQIPLIILRYTLCKFVLANNKNLKCRKAIKIGVKNYKKRRFSLLSLLFKNLHLLLICLLVVPILWVYPILKVRFTAASFAILCDKTSHEISLTREIFIADEFSREALLNPQESGQKAIGRA